MLYNKFNEFLWYEDNIGATVSGAGMGVSTPAHASVHTKNTTATVLAGSKILHDCYFLWLGFGESSAVGGNSKYLVDVFFDTNGGTNWEPQPRISNLYLHQAHFTGAGFYQYAFPLFIRAGTSIGVAVQSSVTVAPLRTVVRVYGKPSAPQIISFGSYVQTLGVTVGSTTGFTLSPGTSAWGSYTASLGTLSRDAWWWQAGLGFNDTTITSNCYMYEVACGNAVTKNTCLTNAIVTNTTEQMGQSWCGLGLPIRFIRGGTSVFVRASGNGAIDTTPTCVVYALGG